jgi:cytidylate kinase
METYLNKTHKLPVIAIDGYSSCGKSTLAKAVANRLGLNYVDSGAMYRAVAFYFLENNIPIPDVNNYDSKLLTEQLANININFVLDISTLKSEVHLNSKNIENEIRSMKVSDAVSSISSLKEVRHQMIALQKKMGEAGGIVMDGRDIGTAVFPKADLKIFMTADPKVRAQRRMDELKSKNISVTFDEVMKNLSQRDLMDTTRKENPLVIAVDAIVLDNTFLTREEQMELVLQKIDCINT